MLGVRPVPTLVTLGNLLCGFSAILLAMRAGQPFSAADSDWSPSQCLYWAGLLIFFAMIFDALDGQVARWTKSTSRFGVEMDSLSDVVSFGVAPAILMKASIDYAALKAGLDLAGHSAAVPFAPIPDRYVWLMMATYAACAAVRLARYNVESTSSHQDFFFGLPSPAAAGCVASLIILITPVDKNLLSFTPLHAIHPPPSSLDVLRSPQVSMWVLFILPFVMLCLGILMVSRVHYIHVGDKFLYGRKSFMHLLVVGLGLVGIVLLHEILLALLFNGYLLLGLVNELRYQFFPSQRPAAWISSAEVSLPAETHPPPSAPVPTTPNTAASSDQETLSSGAAP